MPFHGLGVKREAGALRLHGRIHSCAAPATVSGSGKPRVDVSLLLSIGSHCAFAWEGEGFGSDAHAQCHRSAPQARIPAFATAVGRRGSAGPGMPPRPLRTGLPSAASLDVLIRSGACGDAGRRRSHMGQASPGRDRTGAPLPHLLQLDRARLSRLSLGLGLAFGAGGALAQPAGAANGGSNSLAPVQVEASRHTPLAMDEPTRPAAAWASRRWRRPRASRC